MAGVAGWPGCHVGSTVASDATGEGSEDSMRGRGMWEAGGMGSLEGVDAGVWLGSSGERGEVTGRLRPSYTTVYWGGVGGGGRTPRMPQGRRHFYCWKGKRGVEGRDVLGFGVVRLNQEVEGMEWLPCSRLADSPLVQ